VETMKFIREYEVNRYTMAVLPERKDEHFFSRVMEVDGEYIVAMKPIEIIERSCKFFGSSLQGRREGTKELMGITHKAPIVIDPSNVIYLFPTVSPNRPQCAWISHAYVLHHQSAGFEKTLVTFTNKQTVELPVSEGSFENQLYRTAQLRTIISSRVEASRERNMQFLLYPPKSTKESLVAENSIQLKHEK
jgi:competence protein ComK